MMPKLKKRLIYSTNHAKKMHAKMRALETEEEYRERCERDRVYKRNQRLKMTEEELELVREQNRNRVRYRRKYLMTEEERQLLRERNRIQRYERYHNMTEEQRRIINRKKLKTKQEGRCIKLCFVEFHFNCTHFNSLCLDIRTWLQ